MEITFVRHGEAYGNLKDLSQGHIDFPLTEKGIQQAKAAAELLKNESFDIAYSSDSARAINTAKEILKFHPQLQLKISKELREQNKGIYEGKPRDEMKKEIERQKTTRYKFKSQGGESWPEMLVRIKEFFAELSKEPCKKVLIVGHSGPIAVFLCYLHNEPIENSIKYHPQNGDIAKFNLERFKAK